MISIVLKLMFMVSTVAAQGCGTSYYYGPSGVIKSPGYPGDYSNSLSCNYNIFGSTGSSFALIFKAFDLGQGTDSLKIYCYTNSSIPSRTYRGTEIPGPHSIAWCSQVRLILTTDATDTNSGYSIEYYVSNGGCGNTVYTGPTGHVTSPNYNLGQNYANDQNCSNVLYSPTSTLFYFEVHYMNVEDSTNCENDWVQIGCLDNPVNGWYKFCGDTASTVSLSNCTEAHVWFHSNFIETYRGFDFEYFIQETTVCGDHHYYNQSGVIESPNYPGNYFDYANCTYYIHASSGSSIALIFKFFDVEDFYDTVTISCATNSSIPKTNYTGPGIPDPRSLAWCSVARIDFTSDYIVTRPGFVIEYIVSDGGCGNTVLMGASGHVTSPNFYLGQPYANNLNCSNVIWSPTNASYLFQFRNFSIEGGTNCPRDWVQIGCLDNPANGWNTFCGTSSAPIIVSNCREALVWFRTDIANADDYTGFDIEYSISGKTATDGHSVKGVDGTVSRPKDTERREKRPKIPETGARKAPKGESP